jgi:hypothetical protein
LILLLVCLAVFGLLFAFPTFANAVAFMGRF